MSVTALPIVIRRQQATGQMGLAPIGCWDYWQCDAVFPVFLPGGGANYPNEPGTDPYVRGPNSGGSNTGPVTTITDSPAPTTTTPAPSTSTPPSVTPIAPPTAVTRADSPAKKDTSAISGTGADDTSLYWGIGITAAVVIGLIAFSGKGTGKATI